MLTCGLALEFGSEANMVVLNTSGQNSCPYGNPALWGDKLIAPWLDIPADIFYASIVATDGTLSTLSAMTTVSPHTDSGYDIICYLGLSNGNLLVYWYSDISNDGLTDAYFKIIDTSGSQVVAATKINSDAGELNRYVQAVELSDGKLAFVWATSGANYALRRFTISGSAATAFDAAQISITDLAGLTGTSQYTHEISATTGSLMIAFACSDSATNYSYRGMVFNNDSATPTQVEGSNFFIISERYEVDNNIYLRTLSNGDFLAVYQKRTASGTDTSTRSIAFRVYSPSGSPRAAETVYALVYSWGSINEPLIVDGGFILPYFYLDVSTEPDTYEQHLKYFANTDYAGASPTDYDSKLTDAGLTYDTIYDAYLDVNDSIAFFVKI